MNIGIYDSGLGGLILAKTIRKKLPQYNYIYLGDTKRVPYGDKSPRLVYTYAAECVEYLFKQNCELVIVACNTVSVEALRKLQREYLPKHYPNRRILGVVVPTVEEVTKQKFKKVGLIGTTVTVHSKAYAKELKKLDTSIRVYQKATPLLVPNIENGRIETIIPLLQKYLQPLLKKSIQGILLGCTHYCLIKKQVQTIVGKNITVIAQDDLVPNKLRNYLKHHPSLETKLSKSGTIRLLVTKDSPVYDTLAKQWFGNTAKLTEIKLFRQRRIRLKSDGFRRRWKTSSFWRKS